MAIGDKEPIQIEVQSAQVVTIDVSNRIINISDLDVIKSLGYTPESIENKVVAFQHVPDDIHYPTEKLVKDTFVALENTIQAQWDSFVTLDSPTLGDVLIHDGHNFKNKPKQQLTDGGSW